jgi:hypothetical protein
MKKLFMFSLVLSSGLAFASVEQSMSKVADAANSGVSKMVHGVEKVAKGAENMGNNAVTDMKKVGNIAKQDMKIMDSKLSNKKQDMNAAQMKQDMKKS